MVSVVDLDVPRGKDVALHEFMRRINGVKAATETAIALAPAVRRVGALVVRLP